MYIFKDVFLFRVRVLSAADHLRRRFVCWKIEREKKIYISLLENRVARVHRRSVISLSAPEFPFYPKTLYCYHGRYFTTAEMRVFQETRYVPYKMYRVHPILYFFFLFFSLWKHVESAKFPVLTYIICVCDIYIDEFSCTAHSWKRIHFHLNYYCSLRNGCLTNCRLPHHVTTIRFSGKIIPVTHVQCFTSLTVKRFHRNDSNAYKFRIPIKLLITTVVAIWSWHRVYSTRQRT